MSFRMYLSPPDVGELEESLALDALRSGWVAPLGPHVTAFEAEASRMVGVEHAVALSSGTAALHLGLIALGVQPGDDVIVPTLTFAASAFAVTYVGAHPVFLDSEPSSWNLDPALLREVLSRGRAKGKMPAAVMVVDVMGNPADYDSLVDICSEFGVPMLEDAAEALGSTHGTASAGSFGQAAVVSFNGNKIMTTSGGGMMLTDDDSLAQRVRYLATQARQPVAHYEHHDIGYNYRLSNVLAAIGRAQLQRLPGMVTRRREIRDQYERCLASLDGVRVAADPPWGRSNGWLTTVLMDPTAHPDGPRRVREALARDGIEARPLWKPMHQQPVFAAARRVMTGVADSLFTTGLCLPSGSAMTDDHVSEVSAIVEGELQGA